MHLEKLVTQEAKVTRDMVNTSISTELKASETKAIQGSQRERLLKSLKPEEIRERYNQVLSPSDACYERVFASYERSCNKDPEHRAWYKVENASHFTNSKMSNDKVDKIDQLWTAFTSWLQSNDSIFWIRGKPGAGKSTLIKFIVNNDNTKRLLSFWDPDVRLLSHFFWKIGKEPQNSIKGLLCSLLYNILSVEAGAVELVLEQFVFSRSRDFYKEWSSQEAEEVLIRLLRNQTCSRCIFIDGLDEISDKDGVPALMRVIEKLRYVPRVKVCVSSRPETAIVKRLEAIGAQNLRLEDLTRLEMTVYVHRELEKFSGGQISDTTLENFTVMLLNKAEGVFLWLALATKSLTDGIENGDNEQILSGRLRELPNELEALYEAMWSRLNANNKIYRETASRYFRYVMLNGWMVGGGTRKGGRYSWTTYPPTLAQLSMAMRIEDSGVVPSGVNDGAITELKALCDMAADDIRTRCAGMLQVSEDSVFHTTDEHDPDFPPEIFPFTRKVVFIHRTAHDFLVDTKVGQEILNYPHSLTLSLDLRVKVVKSGLYLLKIYYLMGLIGCTHLTIEKCRELHDKGADKAVILELFAVIQDLYEEGILGNSRYWWAPNSPPDPFLAYHFPAFEDDWISRFVQPDSPQVVTDALRYMALESTAFQDRGPPVQFVQKLIALGGDAHTVGMPFKVSQEGPSVTQQTSAFELFIRGAINQAMIGNKKHLPLFLDIINTMASTCPDWDRKLMIVPVYFGFSNDCIRLVHWEEVVSQHKIHKSWVACVVDMRFLFMQLLAAIDFSKTPTSLHQLHQVTKSFTKPYMRIQHFAPEQKGGPGLFCYRLLAQEPFQNPTDCLFGPKFGTILKVLILLNQDKDLFQVSKFKSLLGSFEKVSLHTEIGCLAQEGIGLCSRDGMKDQVDTD